MKTKAIQTEPAEDYLELIYEFPLRPIKTKAEHEQAMELYSRYAGRGDLSAGQNDYFDALTHFIEEYERRTSKMAQLKMSPIEVLKHLMEENTMSTTDLGYVVGSRGLASELLNEKRGFSRAIVQKLSQKFSVSAELFYRVGE